MGTKPDANHYAIAIIRHDGGFAPCIGPRTTGSRAKGYDGYAVYETIGDAVDQLHLWDPRRDSSCYAVIPANLLFDEVKTVTIQHVLKDDAA